MNKRHTRHYFYAAIAIWISCSAAQGGELKVTSLKASFHDQLINMFHATAIKTTTVEKGYRFLVLQMRYQADFSKDKKRISLQSKHFKLMDAKGNEIRSLGEMMPEGVLSSYSVYISLSERSSGGVYQLGLAYAVPASVKTLTFSVGDYSTTIDKIEESKRPAVSEFLRMKIKSATLVKSVEGRTKGHARVGKKMLLTTLRLAPINGRLLKVVLSVSPLKANSRSTDIFTLNGLHLALNTKNGQVIAPWGFPSP